MALLAAGLLAGCAGSDENEIPGADRQPILLNAGIQQITEGTRATTFDNATALQTERSFTCVAYNANTTTEYISPTTVNWNSTTSQWEFNSGASHYYWPLPSTPGGTYPALDFFAYMPNEANKPNYIGSLEYTVDHNVTFSCENLPNSATGQTSTHEFVYDVATGRNKTNSGVSGVTLTFRHPFARIRMRWAEYDHSEITSLTIKLKNIKNNGSYNKDASPQWTPSGDNTDFTVTTLDANDADPLTNYLVVPQDWTGEIEVTASWNDWGDTPVAHTLTATVPTEWLPGNSYTYTFRITPEDLTVDTSGYTEQW